MFKMIDSIDHKYLDQCVKTAITLAFQQVCFQVVMPTATVGYIQYLVDGLTIQLYLWYLDALSTGDLVDE